MRYIVHIKNILSRTIKWPSRTIFFLLYLCIQFVIAVGEATKLLAIIPFRVFAALISLIYRLERSFVLQLKKVQFIKRVFKIKLPTIKFSKKKPGSRGVFRIFFARVITVMWSIIRGIFRGIAFLFALPGLIIRKIFPERVRIFLLGFIVCLLVLAFYQMYITVKELPTPKDIGKMNYSLSTHLYDRKGKLLYEVYRDENRTPVKLKDLPAYVTKAAIAIEDKDFYKHGGVSLSSGVLRAFRDMILTQTLQGGSTLTQQLVKSALLTPERTIQRKVKEIILALWTEQVYSKDQILEMYLNQVPYGGSAYGIEEASEIYFNKHARELTLTEAALLAGLPQAPSLYSPFMNPELAIWRRNDVLDRLYSYGYISKEEQTKSKAESLGIHPPDSFIKAPHFVFYVKSQLEQIYGAHKVEEGGMRVYTTLDLDVQQQAEKILKEELAKVTNLHVTNGAILVTRPSTGEILAMVGSKDYFDSPDGAFNVVTALRQPGSSIKPVMYSLALQKGYTAATILDDSPVSYKSDVGQVYRPVNYDGKFHGKVSLRMALANSFNIPAVKLLNSIGVDPFVDYAGKLGVTSWTDRSRYGLSLTLGGVEVPMMDMATAYGVFANGGKKVRPIYISYMEDYKNNAIDFPSPSPTTVLDGGVAYILSDILSDNFARILEFGPNSALEIPGYKVAVKTGTTDEKKDNWTIGYTPQYLVAVWVGNNDNSPMNQYLASGITGAAPIWNRMMSYMIKQYDKNYAWFQLPENVMQKTCLFGRKEYFIRGTENMATCSRSETTTTNTPGF